MFLQMVNAKMPLIAIFTLFFKMANTLTSIS